MRVRYAETDADGVVYYANYLTFFEVVRVEWLRALGYPITRRSSSEGIILPVVEARLKYLRPARVDDLLTVRATLVSVGPASFAFDYEVTREDGLLLVTGWTRLAVCERDTTRACAMPQLDARPVCRPAAHGTDLTMGDVYRFPAASCRPTSRRRCLTTSRSSTATGTTTARPASRAPTAAGPSATSA